MTHPVEVGGPVSEKQRIHSLDVLRGVALFGILLMNITAFGMPFAAYGDPSVYGGNTGADLGAWVTTNMLFEGTQRAIFSILFGAGFILLTSRLEAAGRTDTADIYYRRTIWLILFGLVHSYVLLWTGEILFYYGLAGLFLYPLRNMAPRRLIGLAAAGFVVAATWSGFEAWRSADQFEKYTAAQVGLESGGELTEEQQGHLDTWLVFAAELKPDEAAISESVTMYRGGYFDIAIGQAPFNAFLQSWWSYRFFFDRFSMMLLGMALFKLGVLTLERPSRLYWAMVVAGYAVGLTVNYLETVAIISGDFSIVAFTQTQPTYDLGRLGMSTGHLGALLLFVRSGALAWLQRGLAAVGRMALTSYISHSIICALVFYGFGFGLFGELARHQLYYVVFAIWLFQLIVSPLWLARYRFGPLEWLWRSLTYMTPQRMRVGVAAEVAKKVQPA